MKVPRRVVSQVPRSPLGYRVVEVPPEKPPVGVLQPWSPVGYGVTEVSEERGAGACRAVLVAEERAPVRRPYRSPHAGNPPFTWPPRSPLPWVVFAVALFCLVPLAVALMAAVRSVTPSGPSDAGWSSAPINELRINPDGRVDVLAGDCDNPQPWRHHGFFEVKLPEVDRVAVDEKANPAAVVRDEPPPDAADKQPADRETFGTAVGFVRNPREAARLAAAERKLTFVLHVSGNFEDDRFT